MIRSVIPFRRGHSTANKSAAGGLCALCVLCGDKYKNKVVVVDAVRTAFGRAGEQGIFWNTRAEDLCVPLLEDLIERNPGVKPEMIADSVWGVTNQSKVHWN
jgi:hypothetical protein